MSSVINFHPITLYQVDLLAKQLDLFRTHCQEDSEGRSALGTRNYVKLLIDQHVSDA